MYPQPVERQSQGMSINASTLSSEVDRHVCALPIMDPARSWFVRLLIGSLDAGPDVCSDSSSDPSGRTWLP